ncbi:hypothetical protein KCA24_25810, partial [Escherichia coli]|nr:hypothetical protein [Escherichia coli]
VRGPVGGDHTNAYGDYALGTGAGLKTGCFSPVGIPENRSVRLFPDSAGSPLKLFDRMADHAV